MKKISVLTVVALWLCLTAFGWFGPAKVFSETERRPLAQFPEISGETLSDGSFMKDFESWSLDQFPLRDSFRKVKALFHTYVMGQKDNNGIYVSDGHVAELLYPLQEQALSGNLDRIKLFYEKYLKDSNSEVYCAIVPDKGYYLAEQAGYPAMDYNRFFAMVEEALPWATHVELTDCLTLEDYYFTDLHWRQEKLLPAAQKLCEALGTEAMEEFFQRAEERPFYGVYFGQAALPMAPDEMILLENDILSQCTVYDHETGKTLGIYDEEKLSGRDMYEVFLSGARALLTIENPNVATDRELILVRDSFGSSIAPLLVKDYARVTLVDIRYLTTENAGRFLDFHGQDVLFLYSTKVLSTPGLLK